MNVAVCRNLVGHSRQTNQVGASRHDALAGSYPLQQLHVTGFTISKPDRAPRKFLSFKLHEDHGTSTVVNDG
jgi:hypothetical protein